jgi:prevent-host-death family protein
MSVGNITTKAIRLEKTISAADANRNFSQVLREVRHGQSYVVSSHGRPVARIAPIRDERTAPSGARALLLKRLHSERVTNIGHWKRDELYE